jgi:hypothetical protein
MSPPIDRECRRLASAVIWRAFLDATSPEQAHQCETHAIAGRQNHEEARRFFDRGSPGLDFWCDMAGMDAETVSVRAVVLIARADATRRAPIAAQGGMAP